MLIAIHRGSAELSVAIVGNALTIGRPFLGLGLVQCMAKTLAYMTPLYSRFSTLWLAAISDGPTSVS
jgi:hypothetical protein